MRDEFGRYKVGHSISNTGRTHIKKGMQIKQRSWTKEQREALSWMNKEMGIIPPSRKGIKTDISVRRKISKALKAKREQSHLWRGGITSLSAQIRSSIEYKLWRTAVFERDNYTCIWCKAKSREGKVVYLEADHIKPFASYPELRFAIDNGRTLCKPCHKTTDTYLNRARWNK